MFVSLEKLATTPNFRPTKTPNAQTTKAPPPSNTRFHKGDRVITYNKDQIPIHGTVRWTGEANTNSGKVNAVGIETVGTVQL